MYKINHKAVLLVFLLQILVGFAWYSVAPVSLVDNSQGIPKLPPVESLVLFFLAQLVYLYFTAWLLVKMKQLPGFSMPILVIGVWLCCVLPNFVFINIYLHLNAATSFYLLSYGAISCLFAAIILPLWRSSRSIFKGSSL